ncbi:hypothetical protein RDABS01_008285 [Bienertia sinuspersici]
MLKPITRREVCRRCNGGGGAVVVEEGRRKDVSEREGRRKNDGRKAEKDDVLPEGYKVNKGESVKYLAYTLGRMPNIWENDA